MSDTERQAELLEDAPPDERDETIARLEAENEMLRDQLRRLAADADNYRKRQVREKEQAIQFANENLLTELVPVLDNFERAINAGNGADEALVEGVRLVQKQLEDGLARFGVTFFSTVGEPFDPERAEALSMVPPVDVPPGTVVEELQRGYALHGRVVRPARVVVAQQLD